jgi:hypothetical protein
MGIKSPQPPFERGALVGRLVLERGALVDGLGLQSFLYFILLVIRYWLLVIGYLLFVPQILPF